MAAKPPTKRMAPQPKVAAKPKVEEKKTVESGDKFTLKQYKKVFGEKSNYAIDLTSKDVDKKLRTTSPKYTKEQLQLMKVYRKKIQEAKKKRLAKKGVKKEKKVVPKDKREKIMTAIKAYRKKLEERKKKRSSIKKQLIEKISKKYEDKLRSQEARNRQKKAEKKSGTSAGVTGKKAKKSKKKGEKMEVDMLPVDPEKQQKFETKLKKKVSRLALKRYQKIIGVKRPTQGRLFVYAVFTGYRRGQRRQHPNWALLRIEGVENAHDARFYCGKACAYVYKPSKKHGKKARQEAKDETGKPKKTSFTKYNLGRIRAVHGKSGAVRAVFKSNLPPAAMGHRVRVFLYPSNI